MLVVVTGHGVAAVLNAVKAGVSCFGVSCFGVKLVSGEKRTVLWLLPAPCLRMDCGCLDNKAVESTRLV